MPGSPVVTTNDIPPAVGFPRPVQNPFEAQLAMARLGISSGSLDGAIGSQTRAALIAFQSIEGLPATGALDAATKARLLLPAPPYISYTITETDLARIRPVPTTWMGKSQATALDYESMLELVAEASWSHPNFIKRLNPSVNWTNVVAGTVLQVPNVERPSATRRAAVIHIHLAGKTLEAFDADDRLIAHFPCSIAARVEKRPVGELQVVNFAQNPDYTFDPAVFPESAEARTITRKLRIPPGPNNPVGVAWITLDKPGYGIHGTPRPEDVGRTESHGCFRLANWNADYLLRLVAAGTPVVVEP
ncbi:MAG: murein L,D-transpeptidase [Opitutaceae bacterium]|nr:murein L,D-transpeptidase [Verrucomicrobiales bacterium]